MSYWCHNVYPPRGGRGVLTQVAFVSQVSSGPGRQGIWVLLVRVVPVEDLHPTFGRQAGRERFGPAAHPFALCTIVHATRATRRCRCSCEAPQMPRVRKHNRRSLATLIRVRQEVHKRLDAVLPVEPGAPPIASLLDLRPAPDVADTGCGGVALSRLLASRASARYPLVHLAGREQESLPGREELLASATRLVRGEWDVFGQPVSVDVASHDWTRHPFTGARAADAHWTRVPYLEGIGGGDVKHVWELSRHAELVRLSQAYYLTGDEAYAEVVSGLLDRWIEQNPPGRGVNWTSSLEVAFRAIGWCWIWALTCQSPRWDDERLGRFLWSLSHHARHVARFDSVHHSPNTHLTGEALGLLYVGLMFPELARAGEWAELAREILDEELELQVLPDGMHFERATGYHRYTLEFYVHYVVLADAFGLPVTDHLRQRVRDQAAAAWLLGRPDGSWPVIGDEDSGSTLRLSLTDPQDQGTILAVAAALCDQPHWLPNADDTRAAAAWWLLEDRYWERLPVLRSRGTPDAPPSGALPSAGYYVGRDRGTGAGWYCVVDAGSHGGDLTGHAHTDLGHVEIAHGATRLVSDPGCAAYTTDRQARDRARAEQAHACLVVDGEPLAIPAGPFSWSRIAPTPAADWRATDDLWWCELRYDRSHSHGALTHRRQVILAHGAGIAICDWVTGDRPPAMALHWPLGADPTEVVLDNGTLVVSGHRVRWYASRGPGTLRATLESLARSSGYARAQAGLLLRVSADAELPITLLTTFTEASRTPSVRFLEAGRVRVALDESPTGFGFTMEPGSLPLRERPAPVTRARTHGALR